MELTTDQQAKLRAVVKSSDVPTLVATRARTVLWRAESLLKKQVAALAGVSRPTVDLWLDHYEIETWFGIMTRQSIRRGTFSSVKALIKQIRDYITHWNTGAPFT